VAVSLSTSTRIAPWLIRLLLAAILFFGSEILLWTNLTGRSVLDSLLLIPGYLALSTLLLDFIVRYRVRDLPGLMTIAGLYGLLNAMLLNPDTTLFDIPRTLVTRVTGAHTLLGLEMLVLFLALTGGHLRSLHRTLIVGAAGVGLAWGTWVRWSPRQVDVPAAAISIETMLLVGSIGLLVILLLTWHIYRQAADLTPPELLLNLSGGLLLAIVSVALALLRLAQGTLNVPSLALILILGGVCFAMLWFRRETKLTPLIEYHLPVRRLSLIWIGLTAAILFWTGMLAYSLPLIGTSDLNQLTFVIYGFTLYGLAWLPTVSLIIGVRAYIRQIQARPL
jgi:hypothetical protein